MVDGMDKSWFQIIVAINGFRSRYGQWPTIIHLPQEEIDSLAEGSMLAKLDKKLMVLSTGTPFTAEDNQGRTYNLQKDGFLSGTDIDARVWLGLETAPEPAKSYTQAVASEVTEITQPHAKQIKEIEIKGKQKPEPKEKPKKEPKAKPEKKVKIKPEKKAKVKPVKVPKQNKKRNILLVIILSEILLAVLAVAAVLILAVLAYDGHCIAFETPVICNLPDYLSQVVMILPYSIWTYGMQYWWAVLALVILFPLIGVMRELRKRRKIKDGIEARIGK
jgi:hypothetical protein